MLWACVVKNNLSPHPYRSYEFMAGIISHIMAICFSFHPALIYLTVQLSSGQISVSFSLALE